MNLVFVHNRKAAGTSVKAFLWNNNIPFQGLDQWDDGVIADPMVVSFGVCRHPFDRVVSAWKYCDSLRDRSLLDCLLNPPLEHHKCSNTTVGHDYRHFTKLQSDYLFSEDRRNTVTHLLRFETLAADLLSMCGRQRVPLQHLNPGFDRLSEPPYKLRDVDRQMIYQLYYDDFEMLGYSPDDF